jgi:hypothetical protein
MLPAVQALTTTHQLCDVTAVADTGTVSAGHQWVSEDVGLPLILGARIPDVPYVVAQWHREHQARKSPPGTCSPS